MSSSRDDVPGIEKKGIVEGADRIVGELLRNPRFKKSIIILLSSIDPKSARGLVRTLFWGDSDVTLSLMGAAPDLLNAIIEALAETAAQLGSMPPALLGEVLERIAAEIDGYTLGEAVGALVSTGASLAGRDGRAGGLPDGLGREFLRGYLEGARGESPLSRLGGWMERAAAAAGDESSPVRALVRGVTDALGENPEFVERVLKPILAAAAGSPAAGVK